MQPGWERYRAASLLGASLSGQRKYESAEPLLVEGFRGIEAAENQLSDAERSYPKQARAWIVELYQSWGKPAKAAEWLKE